jgi:hypothetical protein
MPSNSSAAAVKELPAKAAPKAEIKPEKIEKTEVAGEIRVEVMSKPEAHNPDPDPDSHPSPTEGNQ